MTALSLLVPVLYAGATLGYFVGLSGAAESFGVLQGYSATVAALSAVAGVLGLMAVRYGWQNVLLMTSWTLKGIGAWMCVEIGLMLINGWSYYSSAAVSALLSWYLPAAGLWLFGGAVAGKHFDRMVADATAAAAEPKLIPPPA